MTGFQKILYGVLLTSAIWTVNGDSTFAGSSVSSDSSGTRSVLVSGRNGVVQTRIGGGPPLSTGSGAGPAGTFASAGGASAYAGPGGAYAGPGGPWGFPYWNGGSYASAGAYPYDYPPPYPYDPYAYNYRGGNVGVYSGSDGNGVQTRFANVAPGGQATIVEQIGDEAPRVYTYRSKLNGDTEKVEP